MKPFSGNKHFFTKSCHSQTYQNYEQPSQNSDFHRHFSVLKIGRIFPKKLFCEEYLIRRPSHINDIFLKSLISQVLYFLKMSLIFVGPVHNFGELFSEKMLISNRCMV